MCESVLYYANIIWCWILHGVLSCIGNETAVSRSHCTVYCMMISNFFPGVKVSKKHHAKPFRGWKPCGVWRRRITIHALMHSSPLQTLSPFTCLTTHHCWRSMPATRSLLVSVSTTGHSSPHYINATSASIYKQLQARTLHQRHDRSPVANMQSIQLHPFQCCYMCISNGKVLLPVRHFLCMSSETNSAHFIQIRIRHAKLH